MVQECLKVAEPVVEDCSPPTHLVNCCSSSLADSCWEVSSLSVAVGVGGRRGCASEWPSDKGEMRATGRRVSPRSWVRPGCWAVVEYRNDEWIHNRVFLCPLDAAHWVVLATDDNRYAESFNDITRAREMTGLGSYINDVDDVVTFAAAQKRAELQGLIRQYREETLGVVYGYGWVRSVDWEGAALKVPEDGMHTAARRRSLAPICWPTEIRDPRRQWLRARQASIVGSRRRDCWCRGHQERRHGGSHLHSGPCPRQRHSGSPPHQATTDGGPSRKASRRGWLFLMPSADKRVCKRDRLFHEMLPAPAGIEVGRAHAQCEACDRGLDQPNWELATHIVWKNDSNDALSAEERNDIEHFRHGAANSHVGAGDVKPLAEAVDASSVGSSCE